jgi:indole-3-glycerol phosphate synthase
MTTYLDRIVAAHRAAAAADERSLDELLEQAGGRPVCRGFAAALATGDRLAVIAEIKRRSPSKGDLAPDLVPEVLAKAYVEGGAACLSVLTDEEFFGGSAADLVEARDVAGVPVLRKDFTVSEHDIADARLMGADAVLLIAAVLSDDELRRFHALAVELGLDALVEVHDEEELEGALAVGARLVGVNQRNLRTFEIDRQLPALLAPRFPSDVVAVAESGVRGADDARVLADLGYSAVLVGETLVRAADPVNAVDQLRVKRCS